MAANKTKQTKKKAAGGETPITIGGGGRKTALPLTIQFVAADWTYNAGLLTLNGGNVKKIKITTDDVDIRLPISGAIIIDLKCGKP
jgi:hypothetical protein